MTNMMYVKELSPQTSKLENTACAWDQSLKHASKQGKNWRSPLFLPKKIAIFLCDKMGYVLMKNALEIFVLFLKKSVEFVGGVPA